MSKQNKEIATEIITEETRVKDLPEWSKVIGYYEIEGQYKHLAGKILTLIDASISNEIQLKAIKDLIKREFHIEIDKWQKVYWNGKTGHTVEFSEKIQELI